MEVIIRILMLWLCVLGCISGCSDGIREVREAAVRREVAVSPGADSVGGTPLGSAQPGSVVPRVSVRDLVRGGEWVGMRVSVTGMCLGYSGERPAGGPPLTRSDWVLEADGFLIYVSGEFPDDCSGSRASSGLVTITAVVAQDTVETTAGGEARRYLVGME